MKYRPDIDGLRAIAVLAVIGYHAFPRIVKGGFIGVDVFFVISGFLITSIIYEDFKGNNFTYKNFYSRRIRRIFPALLILLGANLLFGWWVLFPNELGQLGKHVLGANGFVSNFILWGEAGYFDKASETKPLLHLWSLGIEEQFYIFWPTLLLFTLRVNIYPIIATILLSIISFSFNIVTVNNHLFPTAFYLPNNRVWELMLGCMIAVSSSLNPSKRDFENKIFENILCYIGIILIAIGFLYLNQHSPFPGWLALLPTIGTALLILTPGSWFNRYILSNRILVYIGLISYPLYLWHWSILSYSNIIGYTRYKETIFCIFMSFFLACLTYEFVEKKIRRNKNKYVIPSLIISSLLISIIGFLMFSGYIAPRNNTKGLKLAMAAIGDWEYPKGLKKIKVNGVYVYAKKGAKKTTLFFGDSHIEQYAPRIVKLINKDPTNYNTAIFATRGGCPPVPNVYEDKHPECNKEFRNAIINYALSPEVDTVVVGTSFSYFIKKKKNEKSKYRYYYLDGNKKHYFDRDGIKYAYQALERLLERLTAAKKRVFLLIDNPSGIEFNPETFFSGNRLKGIVDRRVKWVRYDERQNQVRKKFKRIAEKTGAIIIDPVEYFCKDDLCITCMDDGTPIYKDSGHIRPFYVKKYIDFIDIAIK